MTDTAAIPPPSTDEIDRGYGIDLLGLTDEELEIIDSRPAAERLVVSPYVERLDGNARILMLASAFRSLTARGMVKFPGTDAWEAAMHDAGSSAPVEVELDPPIAAMIQARSWAPTVVCAHRAMHGLQDYAYWHVLGGETMLEEFVELGGIHRLRSAEARLLALALYAYLNPGRVAGGEGDEAKLRVGTGPGPGSPAVALAQLTAPATSIGEFLVRSRGDGGRPAIVGVAATEDGRLLMAETSDAPDDSFPVREVAAATLYATIEKAVAGGVKLANAARAAADRQEPGPARS